VPRHPLVAAAGLFAAGVLLAPRMDAGAGPPLLASLIAFAAGLAVIAARGARLGPRIGVSALWLVPAGFLPLGLAAAAVASPRGPAAGLESWLALRGGTLEAPAVLTGSLVEDPIPRTPPGEGCDLLVAVTRVREARRTWRLRGVIRIAAPPAPAGVEAPCSWPQGTRVRLSAALRLARSLGNPGALDYRAFLRARGISALGRLTSARLAGRTGPPGTADAAVGFARRAALGAIERAFARAGSSGGAGFAEAVLLGRRERLPAGSERALQAAGTSHLLAISGFHVGILAAALWLAATLSGAGWRARWLLPAAGLPAYLALTTGAPSASRAVAGACAHAGARLLGRSPAPVNTVAAVFLLFSAARPALVHDAGFQMSFAAAGALAALPRKIGRAGARAALSGAWRTSLMAMTATAPLVALHFNRVAPGALAANLAAGPLMAAGLAASALAIPAEILLAAPAASLHAIPIAAALARTSELCARAAAVCFWGVTVVSEAIAQIPGASFRCATPPAALAAIALAAGAGGSMAGLPPRLRRALAGGSLAAIVWIALPVDRRPADPDSLRVTVFDVGQGSSALVETPEGRRLLVDGGGWSRTSFDVGERVVARALMSLGILRLDAVAASHGDFDHAGGLPSLLEIFDGEELWVAEGARGDPAVARAAAAALDTGRVIRVLARGSELRFGGTRVRALHPPAHDRSLSRNDRSLVLEMESAYGSVLLPGDAERRSETTMGPLLRPAGLLVVPHHGSRGASSRAFLATVRPLAAVVSCGYANSYGHPHAEALARLAEAGAAIFRTDRDGCAQAILKRHPRRILIRHFTSGGFSLAEQVRGVSVDRRKPRERAVSPKEAAGDGNAANGETAHD